jgi:glutathione S-transferase
MPAGNLTAQALQSTQADMSQATAAAHAIVAAVGSAKPWITGQTWTGAAATRWCGTWNGSCRQLVNLLDGQLPSAETHIVSQVRTQMERQQAAAARVAQKPAQPAHAPPG